MIFLRAGTVFTLLGLWTVSVRIWAYWVQIVPVLKLTLIPKYVLLMYINPKHRANCFGRLQVTARLTPFILRLGLVRWFMLNHAWCICVVYLPELNLLWYKSVFILQPGWYLFKRPEYLTAVSRSFSSSSSSLPFVAFLSQSLQVLP